jgi:RHS repeat-associated protein
VPDQDFFTGKPDVEGLGYSFLFRNYRADVGKWQTSDPLGYPDGWNNLAYVNNWVNIAFDPLGATILFTGKKAKQHEAAVKNYLCQTARGREIWNALSSSDMEVTVEDSQGMSGYAYEDVNTKSGTVYWDSEMGYSYDDGDISPALLLGHELGHAYRHLLGIIKEDEETEETEN